jgi:hypothetical protein
VGGRDAAWPLVGAGRLPREPSATAPRSSRRHRSSEQLRLARRRSVVASPPPAAALPIPPHSLSFS